MLKIFFVLLLGLVFSQYVYSGASETAGELAEGLSVQDRYRLSIDDAAIIEQEEISPVTIVSAKSATFVTWTSYPDSYKPGQDLALAWGETWVTLAGEVKERCKAFKKDDLNLSIQQLLGLPPELDAQRFFVELEVQTQDMFRPCANPSLERGTCTANFEEGISDSHKAWYASQSANSYKASGYPWTRLGYTYNWKVGADEVGLSEFVINKGAQVKVVSIAPTSQYCQ